MKKQPNGQYLYSPSDLVRFMESPFASAMERLAQEDRSYLDKRDPDDDQMKLLQKRGYAHEDNLESHFRSLDKHVIKIEGATEEEKREKTLTAMREGKDIIIQAYLCNGAFAGFADFLIKVSGKSAFGDYHYEVWDTKLAHHVKPAFVMQLCCYAEMLDVIQEKLPANITVALGSGENETFRVLDFFAYYSSLKKAFLNAQAQFNSEQLPDPADSKSWGRWSTYAESLLVERDHLFQVATITQGQIKKLNQAGILTMAQLAESPPEKVVKGINAPVFRRLQVQSRLQKASIGLSKPLFEIINSTDEPKRGLALLPPHSPLDVFFDIEGFPLEEGGLEYLWGVTFFNDQDIRDFKAFWAHNLEEEKRALEDFIAWAYARWQQDPRMHIYHYAAYEITACRKLMSRFGVCEHEVDQLLRNEVFVDLYTVVKGGLLLGEPRYSIKNVEHLYRGKRAGNVASGGDSVVAYENFRELRAAREHVAADGVLKEILSYNKEDCDSTQELVEWLREQQSVHKITYTGKTGTLEPEKTEQVTQTLQLRDSLLAQAESERVNNPQRAYFLENLAWMLEFHRREAKPIFWRLYDRLGLSHVELFDDLDCLAGCERTTKLAFKPTARARNLAYEYRFDPMQEFKGASKTFYVLGVESNEGKPIQTTYLPEYSDLSNGLIALQCAQELPPVISLIPNEYVNPEPIPQAIYQVVKDIANGVRGHSAIIHFLSRAKPAIDGHSGGAIVSAVEEGQRLEEIVSVVARLDSSYLAIQGPPGAGKSHTAKHIIATLLKSGAKIGIASNSHKAINHLLLMTANYCHEQGIQASLACTKDTDPDLQKAGINILVNADLSKYVEPSCVIGTTAWGFARDDMQGKLDYLFIDEAGQVAIANLVAMSRSAKNLVLMGDQMQLGQPSQGTHPGDSGLSVLDYLLHDSPAIADDMGVFLGQTYRMHSAVNQFISDYIYEGKLHSRPENDCQVVHIQTAYRGLWTKNAGIIFVPVEHQGNTQASDEEIDKICVLAHQLLECHLTTKDGVMRPVTWADMLFIAPYNHQVRKLQSKLGSHAKVGSVDKFQGQEAPIVFLSMCASDASESLRGLDFLLNKNRINVAISRAKSLAIVAGNPGLANTKVRSIKQLKLVNLFNALVDGGK